MFSRFKEELEIYKLINHKIKIPIGFNDIPNNIKLSPYEILTGESYGKPLIVNMKATPHLLITGLSGQGKSRMLNCIIKTMNEKVRVVLLNGFSEDYKGIKNLIGEENISKFLARLLEDKKPQKNPLYILIEEIGIIQDKKLLKMIAELLMVGRHYNIFIIGIIQVSRAEDIKFKTFFNARISFRQIDSSSYGVALGCSITEDAPLSKREFYLLTDNLYKGKTYNMN